MSNTISKFDDIIDSRDVIARIEELAAIADERTRRPWASDAELIEAVALRVGNAIGDYTVTESECEDATEYARAEGKAAGSDEAREDLAAIITAGFAREDSDRDILRALCAELGVTYEEQGT